MRKRRLFFQSPEYEAILVTIVAEFKDIKWIILLIPKETITLNSSALIFDAFAATQLGLLQATLLTINKHQQPQHDPQLSAPSTLFKNQSLLWTIQSSHHIPSTLPLPLTVILT